MRYAMVIEKAGDNYSAYLPDLPGCVATAKTIEELKTLMQEAAEFYIEGMIEDELPIPELNCYVDYVEIDEIAREDKQWREFSLNQAMKGQEDEDFPEYNK
jgi:predicted RNase H-like HicB family nuclease